MKHWSKNDILAKELPISYLLENSLFYPSSGFDGGVVKYYGKEIQSFIFCDYGVSHVQLMQEKQHFRGYEIFAERSVSREELIPNGWDIQIPPRASAFGNHENIINPQPFAYWIVYQRKADYTEAHGAERFSLLFICGEGVATYQALYWSNKTRPKAISIIQSGEGFGGNWTDFRKEGEPFHWTVMNNPYGVPKHIFYGGIGENYEKSLWTNFHAEHLIKPYYDNKSGEVVILKFGKVLQQLE